MKTSNHNYSLRWMVDRIPLSRLFGLIISNRWSKFLTTYVAYNGVRVETS